jgi:hypothetical protein
LCCKKTLTYRFLAAIEHGAFWLGILPLATVFVFCGGTVFQDSPHPHATCLTLCR